jgi:hypothetical protein
VQAILDEAEARTAAENSNDAYGDQHLVDGQRKFCGPGKWFFGLMRAISTGNLTCEGVSGRRALADRSRYDERIATGQWQEGDDIEYLQIDVVNGEKVHKWVRGQVCAVRWREVRDAPRRELRVTYYANNKRHLETTYWMVPSDLRLRVPRS